MSASLARSGKLTALLIQRIASDLLLWGNMMNKTEYDELVQKMHQYCRQYYLYPLHGECEISDYEYDGLYRQLEVFELANPEQIHKLSPVGKVEGGIHDGH